MRKISIVIIGLWVALGTASAVASTKKCPVDPRDLGIDVNGDSNSGMVGTSGCQFGERQGFPMPDPRCTPGASNPTVKLETLKASRFVTDCLRNRNTSEHDKGATYGYYNTQHPHAAAGQSTCELDHLVPLELGGADSLDNIWPQCGKEASTGKVYFRLKDAVETCEAARVRAGLEDLDAVRAGFASDWTQYLGCKKPASKRKPRTHH